jgi:hypothetical protein
MLRMVSPLQGLGEQWKLRGPNIQPSLARGLLVSSGQGGTYLPQPMVHVAGKGEVPLDELLGPRMTWIVLSGGPAQVEALEPPLLHSGDRVLTEGRDFRDLSHALRKKFGAGSRVLVRPDRVVCLHLPAPSWFTRPLRRKLCSMNLQALREVRPVAAHSA